MLYGKLLRSVGLKATIPRIKILKLLTSSSETHLTAEEVFKSLIDAKENVSLATVYRVLSQFEEAGLIIKHNFDGVNAVYELNSNDHHDHMICMDSGKIIEFYDDVIEQRQKEIAKSHGFDLVNHIMILYVKPKNKKS